MVRWADAPGSRRREGREGKRGGRAGGGTGRADLAGVAEGWAPQMMLANGWALKPNGVVEKPDPQNPNWNVLMISFDDSVRAINVKRHVERAIFWGT